VHRDLPKLSSPLAICLDSVGFTRIERVAHLTGEFVQGGLGFRMFACVFHEGFHPDNGLALPFHLRVVRRCRHAIVLKKQALRAVIAPPSFS